LEAYRYRCFAKTVVDVGEYNVVAGANGSGKTTLLDIPSLLGDLIRTRHCTPAFLQPQPAWETPRAHTFTELIHKQRGDDFVLAIEARLPHAVVRLLTENSAESVRRDETLWPANVRYELRFQLFNHIDLQVADEYLYLFPDRFPPSAEGTDGLVGRPAAISKSGRPELKSRYWRPILYRIPGEAARFCEETDSRTRPVPDRAPPTQLAFSVVSPDSERFPAANWFRRLLEEQVVFFRPRWDRLRKASPPGSGPQLTPTGISLPWLALELQQRDPLRFARWVKHVQTVLRSVEAIRVLEREDDRHALFLVRYREGHEVASSGLSDGTIRILGLTLIPYLPHPPAHLVVEDPEDGLHPRAIEAVLQSLTSVYDGQVWISTQSPVVLSHSDASHVLWTRLAADGSAEIVSGLRHPRLQDWQGSVDLGTVFAAGVLA